VTSDGQRRDPTKSAKLADGASSAGCVATWGDPETAPHLIVAEGLKTTAALVFAHRGELAVGTMALAAALSTGGIRAFDPWVANLQVTVAADRDEGKPRTDRAFAAGERAAHAFVCKYHAQREVRIALPGAAGRDIDWLDVLRTEGVEAVRLGSLAPAEPFVTPPQGPAGPDAEPGSPDPEQIERDLIELVERAKVDPGFVALGGQFRGTAFGKLTSGTDQHQVPTSACRRGDELCPDCSANLIMVAVVVVVGPCGNAERCPQDSWCWVRRPCAAVPSCAP
jgi:hypothetical protein